MVVKRVVSAAAALALFVTLAGCSDADWDRLNLFTDDSGQPAADQVAAMPEQDAQAATPAQPAGATAPSPLGSEAVGGPDTLCTSAAKQHAQQAKEYGYDDKTIEARYHEDVKQCEALMLH